MAFKFGHPEVGVRMSHWHAYLCRCAPDMLKPHLAGSVAGAELTLKGKGFGNQAALLNVTVGGAVCKVVTASDTQIKCEGPASLRPRPAMVQV